MDWWLALVPIFLSIGAIYAALFQILSWLFHKHRTSFFASIIFLSPFGFVLAQATNPISFIWILALTPFYAVFVLFVVATLWMVRFYCAAFAFLMILEFLYHRKNLALASEKLPSFEPFWQKHLKTNAIQSRRLIVFGVDGQKIGIVTSRTVRKYWSLAVSIALLIIVASSFVSARPLRDPTYDEAVKFVTSDKTSSHPYVNATYTCVNFAMDFQASALLAGFKCGVVTAFFPDETSHDLNCFNTTDMGMVYVEPQTDQIVSLNVGQVYSGPNWNMIVKNATVVGYYVTWEAS